MMMGGKNFFIIVLKNIFLFISSCLFLIKLILWFFFSFFWLVFSFLFRLLFNFFFFFTNFLFKFFFFSLLCVYKLPVFNVVLIFFTRCYKFTKKIANFCVIKQPLFFKRNLTLDIVNQCILKTYLKNLFKSIKQKVFFFYQYICFLGKFIVLAFKVILILSHICMHKYSNIYRTILFILQYKYFSLLCKLWYLHFKKLVKKHINNNFILKIPAPYIKNKFILKPITFSFFWYFFILLSSIVSIFVVIGWACAFYITYLSIIIFYITYLFFSILFNYIYLHFKNKFLLIYLFFLNIRLESFVSVNNYISQKFYWKKIYLYRKLKHQNNQQIFLLDSFWYNISYLLLTLHLNNTIKKEQLQMKYNSYSNKYLESADSSIFFKQKAPFSKLQEQNLLLKNKLYVNHEKTWKELGLVGDSLYSRELDWQKNLLSQLTSRRDFLFFQKIKNYFSGKANKTWDKFKITTIIDTYDDFTYYNNANVRLDHFFGDMAAGSEEVGIYKQKKYTKSKRVFLSLFKPQIQQKTLFDLEDDQNIVGLHKQNKVSFFTWKVFYFLLRKHREFQWSSKRLRSVYKKESFDSNKVAGLWNKSKKPSLYKYQRLSWPSFFSKVLPSVVYSFSFLHDIFFSFFVEFLNDFFKSQFNILKLSYNLKNTLSLNIYNKTLYNQFVITFIKIFWFVIYDFWKYFILLGFKIKWNILYILNQESLLKFTLDYTFKRLVYFIQYLNLNDYYLITHLSCYKWESFFLFKIKSYLNVNQKNVDKFSYYYKYGYFLLILDFLLFFCFYLVLFLYDIIKVLLYFLLLKKTPLYIQKKIFFFVRMFVFLTNQFVYLPLYYIVSFKLYFDFFFDLIYSKKYNYLSIKEKRYHMQRYNIQTDLQGNWLESNILTPKIVRFFLVLKFLNKYWWSISIQNKKNLERWPFFYNWFKLLPEIFFVYKALEVIIFLVLYFFKKIWFFCYDVLIINFFFIIKSIIFFSFFFTIKYLFWFIRVVCYEWFLYIFFFNLTSKHYKKVLYLNNKIEDNASNKINLLNIKYTLFFLIKKYQLKSCFNKNSLSSHRILKEDKKQKLSAVESLDLLYSQYDNIIKANKKAKYKKSLNKDLILSTYLLNEVHSFLFYINQSFNYLSIIKKTDINEFVNVRKSSLQDQTRNLNVFKGQVKGVTLDKLWFVHFLCLTKNLILLLQKIRNYNYTQYVNININNSLFNLLSHNLSYQKFLNTSKFNKLTYLVSKQRSVWGIKSNKNLKIFKNLNIHNFLNQQNLKKKYIYYNYSYFLNKEHNVILHKLLVFCTYLKILFIVESLFFIKFIYFNTIYKFNKKMVDKETKIIEDKKVKWKQFNLCLHNIVLYNQIKVGQKVMGLVNFIWFVILYKMLVVEWKVDFNKNQYIPVTNQIKFTKINWYLNKYFYLYRKRAIQEIYKLNDSRNIQNFIYWQQYLFSDLINTPTKTMIIDDFLGVSYKKQFTLNSLIKEEIILLEQQGFFNENTIKEEWKILNINYFLYLKTQVKSLFLYNFSSSRVNLNFKILRILFTNWYLKKRSKKFTSYFWKMFKMSSQAYNLTRRNVSAPWHVFFGSNYSGESQRSFHKYNIKKKDNINKNNTIKERWANFIESIHNYNRNESIIKQSILNFLSYIYPSKELHFKNFKKEPLKNLHFTSQKDFFIKKENILNKRIFLGFFFSSFTKKFPLRHRIKIKFFLWKNYSKTRFFILPAIFFFWVCCFGVPLFFSFDILINSVIWVYQLVVVMFEQWFGLYLLTPFVLFSNYLLIDWCVVLNSILDPIILQVYFLDVNFFFFQFDLVKIFLDWFFLTINNPYIITDYSILKTFYNFCLVFLYISLYAIWSFYLQITWITFIYINYILSFFGISFSIFFWNFFLYWIKNILLFFFYSIYVSYKINLSFVIFYCTLVLKYIFYDFNQLVFIYSHYNEYISSYQLSLIFGENNFIDYFSQYIMTICNIINSGYNIGTFFFNFIFYCCLYLSSYFKTCIIYSFIFLKYWIIQLKSWFFYKVVLYFIYIFQDLIVSELVDYIISIWLWLYFNCLYYLIVYPVTILWSCFFIFIKNIFLFLYWFPYYFFFFWYNFFNLVASISIFFYTQLFLVYNFVSFFFFSIISGLFYLIDIFFGANLDIIFYFNILLTHIIKLLLFPYYFCYKVFIKLGLNFFIINFIFQLKALFYFFNEFLLFFILFIWNGISGIWGIIFLINDTLLYVFPELDKFFYPFGGFSIFYAIFYYYLFIVFSVLWSRSFRIFNDTSKEVPVPDYVWDQVRFSIEGSNIYSLLPLHIYKLLWIEKLSTNTNTTIPKELLDSLDTWTIQEKRLSYQLLVRLEDTPLNFQGFYYKYFTDLTRPFVIKYYRQKFAIKTYLRGVVPWRVYKVLLKRLRYSIWLWYVEGYLAYVTEEEPDAILSVGPSVSDIAGREANFDGQFDVLLKDDAIIEKVKRLKLYNFYFSKKDNTSVGIAHDVWLTFPVIGHVFGRDHLKKIKAMKNREAFIFEFIPEGNQNKGLTARELAIKNYYVDNWTRLNAESIWTITSNKGFGNGATYIEPNEKVLDLKANPQNYKLNRYVKVDEDDGINPDFFNDFMYLGSRSLDLLLTPFLTFAAVNTAWWNQENGMLNASYRFLELSDLADLLVTDYIKNEIKVRSPYKIIRQHFLSSFSSGELTYEFLNLNDEDIELVKYGQPLITKNQNAIKTYFSDEIVSYFPELEEKLEFQGSKNTVKNLLDIPETSTIIDDVLVNIFKEYVVDQTVYDRWGSSLKDLLLYTYSLPEEDIRGVSGNIKAELLDNVYDLKNEHFTLDMFINSLRNMFIDEILYNTSKAQWESAFTSHVVNKSQGLKTKEMRFGQTLNFRYPKLYDKEIEFGRDLSLFEKWRRMRGAAKEKLLEATTASYDVYGDRSLTSELMYKGAHYNYRHALYNYTSTNEMKDEGFNNLVFINYFSEDGDKIVLNKGALSQMVDLGLLSLNKKEQFDFSIRTESGFREAPVEYGKIANRFEIEERDRVLEFLRPQINNIISGIEQHFLTNPDPSMVNLFEETANELFIAKLLLKTTSSSPAFGYFLQYYFLQRLLTLYITAYEGTWFGQLLYFLTRSVLVRLPVTGIDVLPLIALDINNQSDIYYFSGFYGLPRINHLYKEFLIPYTQYTYTQHYLLKSLQQQTLLYFTDRQKFFQELPSNVVNVDWRRLPYLHPDLDVNRRLRMIYQHIYSASFHYPNVYNEGFLLFKIREFIYTLGLEVWLTELKDVFTINNWFLSGGWNFLTHIISFNFWTSFFRSDWVIFVENNQKWFEFTFHLLGYFEQPVDVYKLVWYSMHILEYTKTFVLLLLDITVYLCFPNVSFDLLKIDVWVKIFKSLKANLKLSLLIFENWWYNNFWVYRWCSDITSWLATNLNINDLHTYSLGSLYPYNLWFSTVIHFCAYWKQINIFLPSVFFPKIILNISNLLSLDLYNIFSNYFIDKGLVTVIPLNKQTAYSFFLTHPTSFLYYNVWYDYYLNTFNITKEEQEMFLSQLLRKSLNKRYDLRHQPTLLRENIMSPYSFKINYGNHFLTTYEVNLLYNTNFYKQETIALYHAFDFLLTNPSNAVFYKNFVEIGDSKNNEIGFLFNFQSLYQDLTAMYISTNILKNISVETFHAFKTYEEQLNISNLRFFYYYYYYFNQNYKIIKLSENLPITKLILEDCVKKNIIIDNDLENWSLMFDKNTFTVYSDFSDPDLYFLLKKNIDGSFEVYLQRLR